ncbi:hypothetical protein [Natronobiforma cellulositropha]|uniref:hypothetical protein n=1 Tax=Natronobiforma cellulositropha TaxID=1679076 RepID=UPI0021D5C476|nr:hypothetical protein [Natronobiforma cellulositropha]
MSRLAAVVLVVLLAGCGGFAGEGAVDREPFGVEEPLESSLAGGETAEAVAPGLASDGVFDGDALYDAHHRALDGQSYTQSIRGEYVDERTVVGTYDLEVESAERGRTVLATKHIRGEHGDLEAGVRTHWIDDGERIVRTDAVNGSVSYSRERPQQVWTPLAWVVTSLAEANETSVEWIGQHQGEDLYRLETDGGQVPFTFEANETHAVNALVRGDGLVVQYDLWATDTETGLEYAERTTHTRLGETRPEPPAWLTEAREALGEEDEDEWRGPI